MGDHISCNSTEISSKVIVCGDPKRAQKISEYFENATIVSDNREYWVCSGYYHNEYITVCSTGIGGPSIAIALEELIQYGAEKIIRIGSCGVFQDEGRPGDIFVASGAIRNDGVSRKYLPIEIPCIPSMKLVNLILKEGNKNYLDIKYGLGSCNDVYYKPFKDEVEFEKKKFYKKIGVLFGEMENATLFAVGIFHNIETASILVSDSSLMVKKDKNYMCIFNDSMDKVIKIVLNVLANAKEDS